MMQDNSFYFIRRHRLLTFFLITYGISWGIPGLALLLSALTRAFEVSLEEYSPLSYLVIWSPAISALTVICITQGQAGIRAYLRRLLHWRVGWVWYVAVLLGVPFMNLLAAALMKVTGNSWLVAQTVLPGVFWTTVLLKGTEGPFEEFGWRGFALPLLQRRYSGLSAAVIVGFFWMLWHVPGFFVETVMTHAMQGSMVFILLRLFIGGIVTSITMTVIYNGSGGSIPLMFLWHWLSNIPYPWEPGSGISVMQDVLIVVVALILVLTLRRRYLGKENLFTDVTPGTPEPVDHFEKLYLQKLSNKGFHLTRLSASNAETPHVATVMNAEVKSRTCRAG
jgi:membrane protease YdiL (CAAX protease family)